jgi:serine/threonine protein kinase
MIYEKADRNLEEFMARHRNASDLQSLGPQDLAQQLAGIVGAVLVIHTQTSPNDNSNLLPGSQHGIQKSGYLHDIKPDNLLIFRYHKQDKESYTFRLSDFSCARVVAFIESVSGQHRRSWQSTGKSGTPIYRAPELTTEGKTSRPYDIWSLGCVLLEVLVWFTEGYRALEAFRESRFRAVKPNGIEDEGFYYLKEPGPNARAYLREQVAERLEAMPSQCEGSLRTIAEAIPQMLEIEPAERPTAEQLVKRLKSVGQASQPPTLLTSTITSNLPPIKASFPSSPTYYSESDSDFGPMVNIQRPTDE